jgi:AcrR family transcriptional regulator
MPRKRFADLEQHRRERILGAAAREFAERGYEAASVNRIIIEAGISKGSLYYYFDDKEDLFATVVEQAAGQFLGKSGLPSPNDLTAETFWRTFRELTLRTVDLFQADEWYVGLTRSFLRFRRGDPNAPAIRRMIELWRSQLHDFLSRGQELKVVRSDLPLPFLVDAALAVDEGASHWLMEHWEGSTPARRRAWADAQADLIRDMLHAKNEGWEE